MNDYDKRKKTLIKLKIRLFRKFVVLSAQNFDEADVIIDAHFFSLGHNTLIINQMQILI